MATSSLFCYCFFGVLLLFVLHQTITSIASLLVVDLVFFHLFIIDHVFFVQSSFYYLCFIMFFHFSVTSMDYGCWCWWSLLLLVHYRGCVWISSQSPWLLLKHSFLCITTTHALWLFLHHWFLYAIATSNDLLLKCFIIFVVIVTFFFLCNLCHYFNFLVLFIL
jgi:hypothetical protein